MYVITNLEVKGEGKNYQGLFGFTSGAAIRNVALEDININGHGNVGGLVGEASSSAITNSYATGSVIGTGDDVGGLVGEAGNSTIENSYATGLVTGAVSFSAGGLVGYAYDSTVTSSYWDTQTTGQTRSARGTGKSTGDMKKEDTYSGWNFDAVWEIDEGIDYPKLR